MKNNIKTYMFVEEKPGKTVTIEIEYSFEENSWIIKQNTTIYAAITIAKRLKNKYYNKKQWVVSWNNKNTKINFIEVKK